MLKNKSCFWNGIEYASIEEAAQANNVVYSAMVYRLSKGYTNDEDLNKERKIKKWMWNGKKYATIKEAAVDNNEKQSTLYSRIKAGHKNDSDVKKYRKQHN